MKLPAKTTIMFGGMPFELEGETNILGTPENFGIAYSMYNKAESITADTQEVTGGDNNNG